ncbi:MAG: hypothetical protein JXA90_06730 [Planctomycetes bacterium]|nr:hypothetical protein [Planctomycetota bacterium]
MLELQRTEENRRADRRPRSGCALAGRSGRRGGRAGGFTFLELIAVIGLIGILLGLAVLNFDGLIPRYRLRVAIRQLAKDVEAQRLTAVTRGVWVGVRYTLEPDDSYYQLIPPPPKEYPQQPVHERTPGARVHIPGDRFHGVYIRSVQIRGADEVGIGSVLVLLSPSGTSGSHTVTMANDHGQTWTMLFNALTGTVDFVKNEVVQFEDFDG